MKATEGVVLQGCDFLLALTHNWRNCCVVCAGIYLTTVPLIARKKRMEKNAPSTLSAMKAARAQEGDSLCICGIWGGSTNSP